MAGAVGGGAGLDLAPAAVDTVSATPVRDKRARLDEEGDYCGALYAARDVWTRTTSAYALLTALAAAVQTCKDPELTERVLSRGEIEASASNGGEDPQVDWGGPGNGAGGSRS